MNKYSLQNFWIKNFLPLEIILERQDWNVLKTLLNLMGKIGYRMIGEIWFQLFYLLFLLWWETMTNIDSEKNGTVVGKTQVKPREVIL